MGGGLPFEKIFQIILYFFMSAYLSKYNETDTKHVVRTDTSKMEESPAGPEVKDEDSAANVGRSGSSIRSVKVEKSAKKEKQAGERVGRRKNFVETRWPSESELKAEDDSNSTDLSEETLLVSLIIN